jgi:hypothetical protein
MSSEAIRVPDGDAKARQRTVLQTEGLKLVQGPLPARVADFFDGCQRTVSDASCAGIVAGRK